MTHSPVGMYSSALHHTNHERDKAGMTSDDLQKRVFKSNRDKRPTQRNAAAKNYGESPDLHYCLNRVQANGTPIENPLLDPHSMWDSNAIRSQLGVAKAPERPMSARERTMAGSTGDFTNKHYSVNHNIQSPGVNHTGTLRQTQVREAVPTWPRNWGRVQSMTRSFEKAAPGETVRCMANIAAEKRGATMGCGLSDGGSVVSGSDYQRSSQRSTGGYPRSSARVPETRQPRSVAAGGGGKR